MYTITYDAEGELANANGIKSVVIEALRQDGVIDDETADTIQRTYIVSIAKKSTLFSWFKSKFNSKEDPEPCTYIVSKTISPVATD